MSCSLTQILYTDSECLQMLLNLHKKSWVDGLTLDDYSDHCQTNENTIKSMLELAKNYNKALEEEESMTSEQLAIKNVGKQVRSQCYICPVYSTVMCSSQVNLSAAGP